MQKHDQIERARQEFAELMNAIVGMDEDRLTVPAIGQRSVRDVMAHITGWTLFDTEIMRRLGRGERPIQDGEFDIDTRNAGYAAEAASKSPEAVNVELRAAFDKFIDAATALPEDRITEGRTAHRMMQGPAYEHLKEHRAEVAAYGSTIATE